MSEDISAHFRLAVEIVIFASFVTIMGILFTQTMLTADQVNTQVIGGLHSSYQSVISDVVNAKWISSAEAYKFIQTNGYGIGTVQIVHLDGTTLSNPYDLLTNAQMNVKVKMTTKGNAANYIITEVPR